MPGNIKFAIQNKYLPPSVFEDIFYRMQYMRLGDCVDMMDALKSSGQIAYTRARQPVKMEDLEAIYGQNVMADSVAPVWFHCGPELEDGDFGLICSPPLYWCMDNLLYRITRVGLSVLKDVGLA